MSAMRIPKKKPEEIDRSRLMEPVLGESEQSAYRKGWELFNNRKFWDAHEAWESVWLRVPDESRIFFQGIIQIAAAYHLVLEKKRYGGALRNFEKAEEKLRLFPPAFLGISVDQLLDAIGSGKKELREKGPDGIERFDRSFIPTVALDVD